MPKASDAVVLGVTDSAVPTLLLSGSFDGQTGPQFVRYVAPHLRRSTEATVPGVAHGVFGYPCGATIISSILRHSRAAGHRLRADDETAPIRHYPPP